MRRARQAVVASLLQDTAQSAVRVRHCLYHSAGKLSYPHLTEHSVYAYWQNRNASDWPPSPSLLGLWCVTPPPPKTNQPRPSPPSINSLQQSKARCFPLSSGPHMLVVNADSSGGHPECLIRLGGAVAPVRVPQTRRDRLERLL